MTQQQDPGAPDGVRAQLETEKLRREINDLRFGWLKTAATAAITAAVSLAVAYYTIATQLGQQRTDYIHERQTAYSDRFFRARDGLANSAPGTRINSALDLEPYLHATPDPDVPNVSPASGLSVLESRLALEDDPNVLAVLASVISGAGPQALPGTVTVNRNASQQLSRLYGSYIHNRSLNEQRTAFFCQNAPLDAELSSIARTVEEALDEEWNTIFFGCVMGTNWLSNSYREGYYQVQQSMPREDSQTVTDINHWMRVLLTTSHIIQVIVVHNSIANVDLSHVILYDVDMTAAHLHGANLRFAYVSGIGDHTDLSKAWMSDASIQNWYLTNSDARNAIVTCALFEGLEQRSSSGKIIGSQVNFSGANWWSAVEYYPHPDTFRPPWWLRAFYPEPPTARKCPYGWVKG